MVLLFSSGKDCIVRCACLRYWLSDSSMQVGETLLLCFLVHISHKHLSYLAYYGVWLVVVFIVL